VSEHKSLILSAKVVCMRAPAQCARGVFALGIRRWLTAPINNIARPRVYFCVKDRLSANEQFENLFLEKNSARGMVMIEWRRSTIN